MALNDKIPNWPEAAHANARRSLLAADLVIDGDVTSDGPVDVHGKIVGSASAPEVLVAATGRIEGTVSAHDLSVLGFVSGSVSARHIHLSPSAVVHADGCGITGFNGHLSYHSVRSTEHGTSGSENRTFESGAGSSSTRCSQRR